MRLTAEKDFQRLHKRLQEGENDLFPNPKA